MQDYEFDDWKWKYKTLKIELSIIKTRLGRFIGESNFNVNFKGRIYDIKLCERVLYGPEDRSDFCGGRGVLK